MTMLTGWKLSRVEQGKSYSTEDFTKIAKEYASERGTTGGIGGWIYNSKGHPLCQGWFSYWQIARPNIEDWLTRKLTASDSFFALLTTPNNYRPTILTLRGRKDWRYMVLADLYDAAQEKRNDPRRAFRGTRFIK